MSSFISLLYLAVFSRNESSLVSLSRPSFCLDLTRDTRTHSRFYFLFLSRFLFPLTVLPAQRTVFPLLHFLLYCLVRYRRMHLIPLAWHAPSRSRPILIYPAWNISHRFEFIARARGRPQFVENVVQISLLGEMIAGILLQLRDYVTSCGSNIIYITHTLLCYAACRRRLLDTPSMWYSLKKLISLHFCHSILFCI